MAKGGIGLLHVPANRSNAVPRGLPAHDSNEDPSTAGVWTCSPYLIAAASCNVHGSALARNRLLRSSSKGLMRRAIRSANRSQSRQEEPNGDYDHNRSRRPPQDAKVTRHNEFTDDCSIGRH